MIDEFDLQLWGKKIKKAYDFIGAHPKIGDMEGTHFVVSAPSATRVSVVGSFNNWDGRMAHRMRKYHEQGFGNYLFLMLDMEMSINMKLIPLQDPPLQKADPFAFYAQLRPDTDSKVFNIEGQMGR